MQAETVAVGTEILAGHTPDANFGVIADLLAREGIALVQHTVVPDERESLSRILSSALERSALVIMTGGLGATPDDVTRRVMASALGRKLIFREPLLAALRAKFEARGVSMSPAAEAMALVPSGVQPLENRVGVAPGLFLRTDRCFLFALPGVPAEMRQMLAGEVLPLLRRENLAGRVRSETLRTVGVSETALAEWVMPQLGQGVRCSFLPAPGRVDLRLWIRESERDVRELEATVERIAERLGAPLYGRGQVALEESVVALLAERGLTLGLAESLTGGRVGAAVTRVPGSSRVFRGTVTAYDNRVKEAVLGVSAATLQSFGAVSGKTAEEMAAGARRILSADVAISTTGIAGPGGGSADKPVGLVYFGMSDAHRARSLRYHFGGDRDTVQERCVTVALNMLRLLLLDRLDLLWSGERRRQHG